MILLASFVFLILINLFAGISAFCLQYYEIIDYQSLFHNLTDSQICGYLFLFQSGLFSIILFCYCVLCLMKKLYKHKVQSLALDNLIGFWFYNMFFLGICMVLSFLFYKNAFEYTVILSCVYIICFIITLFDIIRCYTKDRKKTIK